MEISEQSEAALARTSAVEFTGSGREFFGIWIVNILLTIVTLGIYSAWAKVRTTQYFYGHTKVDGHSFRYLATPLQILKGRLIALAIFALFSLISALNPALALVALLLLLLATPWMIVQGMKFNLRMTSYRNLRFGFHGRYGEAFVYCVLFPFLSIFTFYLALPAALKKMDQFIYGNISLGGHKFEVQTRYSGYYYAVLLAALAGIGLLFVFVLALLLFGAGVGGLGIEQGLSAGLVLVYLLFFLFFQMIAGIYAAHIRNHLFENSHIPGVVRLKSELSPMYYAFVIGSNAVLVVCSLGLAYPWTKVIRARLLAEATTVKVYPQADRLVDKLQQDSSVLAEQAADFFDVDLSLT